MCECQQDRAESVAGACSGSGVGGAESSVPWACSGCRLAAGAAVNGVAGTGCGCRLAAGSTGSGAGRLWGEAQQAVSVVMLSAASTASASPTMGACSPATVCSLNSLWEIAVLFPTILGLTKVAEEPVSTSAEQLIPPMVTEVYQQSPTHDQPCTMTHSIPIPCWLRRPHLVGVLYCFVVWNRPGHCMRGLHCPKSCGPRPVSLFCQDVRALLDLVARLSASPADPRGMA